MMKGEQELAKEYEELVKAYDKSIEGFFEALDTACTDLIMDNKIPMLHDNQVEKVFDETPQDLSYKQAVKRTFVGAIQQIQTGQDVKRNLGNLPKEIVQQMKEWCDINHNAPYPSEAEKQTMSKDLNLSISQISQWFSNYRKRTWRPSMNEDP